MELEKTTSTGQNGSPPSHPQATDASMVPEYPYVLIDAEVDELIHISIQEGYHDKEEYPNHIHDVIVTNCDSIRCMTEPFINELYGQVS
eukprot:11861322-Ditylum_brightwellii.AAC.1